MPVFRSRASGSLRNSIAALMQGSGITPLQEMQADMAASQTGRNLSLAEKARAEAEQQRMVTQNQQDPALAQEYAQHVAGINTDDSSRLMNHIKGVMEQPAPGDIDDAGGEVVPYRTAAPNLAPGQDRLFRSAIASTIANRIATGKTNASQLAQAGGRINDAALTSEAANTEDVPTANRIVAAVAGKIRTPYHTNAQGVTTNNESGDVNEGSQLATAVRALSGARAATEGSRQTELASRSQRNREAGALASARGDAVRSGRTDKGGARVTPQQIERWVSEVARKEWDALPGKQRRGMNYDQHLDKVRDRFTRAGGGVKPADEIADAQNAIGKGAPAKEVRARFEKRMGFKLPEVDIEDGADDEGDDD